MLRRLDVRRAERMWEFGTFRPTATERVPRAYLVPPDLVDVIDRLGRHGVQSSPLAAERSLPVETFRIDSAAVAEREFQGHRERTLHGQWEASAETVPAGTVVVPVDQPLGRLVFYLLEPYSDDGFANWALLDRQLENVTSYPIMRTNETVR
jgi:hypothetical protein